MKELKKLAKMGKLEEKKIGKHEVLRIETSV
jgi:hypothetical protein